MNDLMLQIRKEQERASDGKFGSGSGDKKSPKSGGKEKADGKPARDSGGKTEVKVGQTVSFKYQDRDGSHKSGTGKVEEKYDNRKGATGKNNMPGGGYALVRESNGNGHYVCTGNVTVK